MSAQFNVAKKVRPARLNPKKQNELHEDGHSWAVSYADFLMVLLSFFILFFSMEKNQRTQFIQTFLATNDQPNKDIKNPAPATYSAKNDGTAKEGILTETKSMPAELQKITSDLKGFYVDKSKPDKIIIYFEDNIYKLGSFNLPLAKVQSLNGLLKKIEPFMKQLRITFVGHTDGSKKFKHHNKYIKNNFDLSSLRATNALQQAVKSGYNPETMFAQGVAEHGRASRTISLILSPGDKSQ